MQGVSFLLSQDRCKALFKQVHQEKQLRGRAMDAVAAACLFIACRQEDVPRSFKEICAVSRHPKKEIGRCFKLIRLATNTEVNPVSTTDFMVRSSTYSGINLVATSCQSPVRVTPPLTSSNLYKKSDTPLTSP